MNAASRLPAPAIYTALPAASLLHTHLNLDHAIATSRAERSHLPCQEHRERAPVRRHGSDRAARGVTGGRQPGGLGVARRRRAAAPHRHVLDGERAHHHRRDRVRGAVAAVGDGAARVGRRARRDGGVRRRHLLHRHAPGRVLPHRRRGDRRPQLHLHRRRPRHPRRRQRAIKRAGCFHANGHNVPCHISSTPYMLIFGAFEIVFSQIPDFHEIWWLSIVAAVMSFTYSGVGLGLGIAQTVADGGFRGTIAGVTNVTATQKAWRSLQALGNIAFAFAFSNVYTEIQDTIKAPPPSEAKVMKQASLLSIVATSVFYALCGWMGYAAFGNAAPDNLLTGFGFFEPFWLVDAANVAIAVHLIGAYQVYCQPVFAFVERKASRRWPDSGFVNSELRVWPFAISAFRLAWRSVFVCFTTVVAMALPFFGVIVGLLGAISFWPLTVYLPTEMYIAQRGVRRGSALWIGLRALAVAGFVVSAAATTGAVANFVGDFMKFRPFSG
ncbi:Os12g0195100 [Oryza sativa Japonica Group]|uniref:Os12g0195100 protein n=1 Tax=Oryza sativa subsp. japonica TaxID=39947 RepID=A0A0N7KTQ0_ORYSJ|nr:hypothetical protein EE612_058287 [Oryza sativa]BAT16234.1 Os12g0195100 [Oryza sativa Japonica Group]